MGGLRNTVNLQMQQLSTTCPVHKQCISLNCGQRRCYLGTKSHSEQVLFINFKVKERKKRMEMPMSFLLAWWLL